jgi:hypothetical protein
MAFPRFLVFVVNSCGASWSYCGTQGKWRVNLKTRFIKIAITEQGELVHKNRQNYGQNICLSRLYKLHFTRRIVLKVRRMDEMERRLGISLATDPNQIALSLQEVFGMLAPHVVAEIKRLLAEGTWSQRKIARHLSVSRGIVSAIASGKRPERRRTPYVGLDFIPPSGTPERCPRCGALVIRPCVACQLDWLPHAEEMSSCAESRQHGRSLSDSQRNTAESRNERRRRSEQNVANTVNRGAKSSFDL